MARALLSLSKLPSISSWPRSVEVVVELLVGPVALLDAEEDPDPFADAAPLEPLDASVRLRLLDDVGELVGQQVPSRRSVGVEMAQRLRDRRTRCRCRS